MPPPVISLVPRRFEDGGWGGVPRFDFELRGAIPGLISLNTRLPHRLKLAWLAKRHPDAVVITGNELSVEVPDSLRTVVMHHGCAQTHFDRDPEWRDAGAQALVRAQREMYSRPNRWFVAAARWTSGEFSRHYGVPEAPVLPNWVAPMARNAGTRLRPVVLGDWRTFNKGSSVIDALRAARADLEFKTLACEHHERPEVYGSADAWLCLSLSEGGAYAVADAEATQLPVVTTDVGNVHEFTESVVVPWQERDQVARVSAALDEALALQRTRSFYTDFDHAAWTAGWRHLLEEVCDSGPRAPLLPRSGNG